MAKRAAKSQVRMGGDGRPNLRTVSLARDRITDWDAYPFGVPVIRNLTAIELSSRVCFFVGENGSGKSTLLEAMAEHCGFGREGGSRNIRVRGSADQAHEAAFLSDYLTLSWSRKLTSGYFLRAESFFNVATYLDEMQLDDPRSLAPYGDRSLHQQSHGESFLTLVRNRLFHSGFYLLDEPEAALSPQRQLAFLVILHEILTRYEEVQFVIATHSPILMAYPGAQILSFDDSAIRECQYQETEAFRITSDFLASPQAYLHHLFE